MTNLRGQVFDAMRAAARPGIFEDPGNILALDNLCDAFGVPRGEPLAQHRLGALSEQFESGGRGPGTVSSGVNDPGGVSYGLYQLASKTGTLAAFLKAEGERWSKDFLGKPLGGASFSNAWKAVAARDGKAFGDAQHAFIERTHYRPVVDAVKSNTGLDIDTRSAAVRDAVWSTAVQHGAAVRLVTASVGVADKQSRRDKSAYDRALIGAIYDNRTVYLRELAAAAGGPTARTFSEIIKNRYPQERQKALEMLG